MGVCCGRYLDPPHIELANQVDKRIQAKQGLKTAQQLAEQNGRFAEVCGVFFLSAVFGRFLSWYPDGGLHAGPGRIASQGGRKVCQEERGGHLGSDPRDPSESAEREPVRKASPADSARDA